MKYKRPELDLELVMETHPDVRRLLLDFDEYSAKVGWPEPLVTCLRRTPEENARVGGHPRSYHLCDCAADLSIRPYDEGTLPQVATWFRGEIAKRGGKPKWGFLVHDVGSGPHIHVERRDASWRATYEKRSAS